MVKKIFRCIVPPYDSLNVEIEKSEIFRLLSPINMAQRSCQPHCLLLHCLWLIKYLYLKFNLAQRGHTMRGRKRLKRLKYG